MRPSLYPRLINGPFDDPGLLITFQFEKRTVLFDLGDIHTLPDRDILKTSHVFITHTHMDHWMGFDKLIRLHLGREKILFMYGPEGFLKNIEGKLTGYSWNLVQFYDSRFTIIATEIHPEQLITQQYACHAGFIPAAPEITRPFDLTVLEESDFSVSAVILDHLISCAGYCIKEQLHVNIKKNAVLEMNLPIGPWLKTFKHALYNNETPELLIQVQSGKKGDPVKTFKLGDLMEKIAVITPGQKVVYFADVGYTETNVEKMIVMAMDADHLFIEAPFLDKDRKIAEKKYHLTAKQAGSIAGRARVKHFTLFHFSPRYQGKEHLFHSEAAAAYDDNLS